MIADLSRSELTNKHTDLAKFMVSWIEGLLSLGVTISQRKKPGIIAEAKKHQYTH
jgi:hypothetical protein